MVKDRKRKIEVLEALVSGTATIDEIREPGVVIFIEVAGEPGMYEANGRTFTSEEKEAFCRKAKRDIKLTFSIDIDSEPIMEVVKEETVDEVEEIISEPVFTEVTKPIRLGDRERAMRMDTWKRINATL